MRMVLSLAHRRRRNDHSPRPAAVAAHRLPLKAEIESLPYEFDPPITFTRGPSRPQITFTCGPIRPEASFARKPRSLRFAGFGPKAPEVNALPQFALSALGILQP